MSLAPDDVAFAKSHQPGVGRGIRPRALEAFNKYNPAKYANPTLVKVTPSSVSTTAPANTVIGPLTTTDNGQGTSDTYAYAITSAPGPLGITGTNLVVKTPPLPASGQVVNVTVKATGQFSGKTVSTALVINITA